MARKKKEWHRGKTVEHALDVVEIDRDQLAVRLSSVTGDEWSYRMVHNLIGGDKTMTADIVWALSKATGLPYSWFLDDPREGLDLRDLNAGKPLYLRSRSGYEPIPDDHPINALVEPRAHYRDTLIQLPREEFWTEPLQRETLPLRIPA